MLAEKKEEKSYGKFKGIVRVTEHNLSKKYEKAIEDAKNRANITKTEITMKNYNKYNELRKNILNRKEVIIRVYILEMNELPHQNSLDILNWNIEDIYKLKLANILSLDIEYI